MTDFERPVDRVRRLLPGTLEAIAAASGYPAGVVMDNIRRLRAEGDEIVAISGQRDEDGHEPTEFHLLTVVAGRE